MECNIQWSTQMITRFKSARQSTVKRNFQPSLPAPLFEQGFIARFARYYRGPGWFWKLDFFSSYIYISLMTPEVVVCTEYGGLSRKHLSTNRTLGLIRPFLSPPLAWWTARNGEHDRANIAPMTEFFLSFWGLYPCTHLLSYFSRRPLVHVIWSGWANCPLFDQWNGLNISRLSGRGGVGSWGWKKMKKKK